MAKTDLANSYLTDGMKAVPLNALPPEAWTFITGEGPDVAELKDHFKKVPWLFRGVMLRAQRLTTVPFSIFEGDNEIDTSEAYSNKLKWLPNPFLLLEQIESDLTLHSRSYLIKDKNIAGRPLGLRRLHPPTIRPRIDAERGLFGFVRTVLNRPQEMLDVDDLVYFSMPDPWSELGRATSPGEAALNAAGVLLNMDEFSSAFFKRGAVKVTLLTVSGSIQEDERDRLEGWWKRLVGGMQNAFGGKVINADRVTPVPIGEGLEALGNTQLSKDKREDIATALGIPQSLLFSTGAVNRSVSQQDDLNFYSDTIIPEAKRIERTLNAQLLEPLGFRLQFRPQALSAFQEDESARSMALLNLVQAGERLENAYQILGYDLPEAMSEQKTISPNGRTPPIIKHLEQWRGISLGRMKEGREQREFRSDLIPWPLNQSIAGALSEAKTENEVQAIFDSMIWNGYP